MVGTVAWRVPNSQPPARSTQGLGHKFHTCPHSSASSCSPSWDQEVLAVEGGSVVWAQLSLIITYSV